MKKFLMLTGLLVLALACLVACPANGPTGTTTGSQGAGNSPSFPEDGSSPAGGAWGFYTVAADKTGKSDYTALTDYANGKFASGDAYLANGKAQASASLDVAYGYTAEKDGTLNLSLGKLAREGEGSATLAVYKNGVRIWPVSADVYEAAETDRADLLDLETAVKAGDVVYFRISAEGKAAALALKPVATYTDKAYTAEADLEQTRPDYSSSRIEGIGATLAEDSLALTGRTPGTAEEITSDEFLRRLSREELVAGTTYRLTDGKTVAMGVSRADYDGLNCVVVTSGNIVISGAKDTALANLTLIADGGISFKDCNGLNMTALEFVGNVTAEASCTGLRFENCRMVGGEVGFANSSVSATVVDCCITGKIAVSETTEVGGIYENCILTAEDIAASFTGEGSTVWYSTLRGSVLFGGQHAINGLVAMNRFENLGGVSYSGIHNSVVLLNELENVKVSDSTNAYVCSNLLYDRLAFENVNYAIATRNTVAANRVLLNNIKNHNGDNITDITARNEYGANEDLLPHVNKDAFINMTRKNFVRTGDGNTLPLDLYINANVRNNGQVIIAPGAYACESRITIGNISDCTVYAYGVLLERAEIFEDVIFLNKTTRVSIRGLAIDMVINGCGTLVVVGKENGTVTYRAGAGGLQDHLEAKHFSYAANNYAYIGYREGSMIPYADVHLGNFYAMDPVTKLHTSVPESRFYEMIRVGDVMTCRANGYNVVDIYDGTANHFEDVSVLSGSVRCFWDYRAEEGTILDRVLVSPAPAKVIDKATYDEYIGLEEKYGVDFGVYIDEWGNYRGTPHRTVTADSTHTTYSRTGMKVTSCIFENLSDDGTNHQGSHGRLAGYNPETGIITYKYNRSISYGYTAVCFDFAVGDRVYVYTDEGQKVCDTVALDATSSYTENGVQYFRVRVDPASFKEEYLRNYNLGLSGGSDRKVFIDNRDRNGDGFVYDNIILQNIRSRGLLVKSGYNTIKNCTLRNIGMAAIGLIFEPEWGESGICDNTEILNNYIENTGFFRNQTLYSPITVMGLSRSAESEEYLPYANLVIKGNVIRNRATDYSLYLNSAMNVEIADNDFGTKADETAENPFKSVFVDYAMDVRFSGNTYSPYIEYIDEQIEFNGHRQIGGEDIAGSIPDDAQYQ